MVQSRMYSLIISIAITIVLGFSYIPIYAQQSANPITNETIQYQSSTNQVDSTNSIQPQNYFIAQKLERARQKYLRALSAIENDDTLSVPRLFEEAVQALNSLASYPGIDQNEDFTDLAQSIIEDYESYVQSIDSLSETSSAFMLRQKIYQEVEDIATVEQESTTTIVRVPYPLSLPSVTIPLEVNEYVEKNLTFLTEARGRKFFRKWLERSGKWFPLMRRIAREENMPDEIIFLSMIESALDPNATSGAKAVGLWQFMQATAGDYNLKVNLYIDERRDPEKATRAAMRYLKWLFNEFGDWYHALAAYNSGPNGPVKRGIEQLGRDNNPSFWDIRDFLPRETKNYVPLFIATSIIGSNPTEYGFDLSELTYEPEYVYDIFTVGESISLKALANCTNQPLPVLKSLNPELVGISTPPDGPYQLKIPLGSKDIFSGNYSAMSDEDKHPWITYEVKKGETLASIAADYGITTQDVLQTNPSINAKNLSKGSVLRLSKEIINAASLMAQNNAEIIDSVADNKVQTSSGAINKDTILERPISIITKPKESVQNKQNKDTIIYATSTVPNIELIKKDTIIPVKKEKQNSGNTSISLSNTKPVKIFNIDTAYSFEHKQAQIASKEKSKSSSVSIQSDVPVQKSTIKHIVKSGESLYSLAQKYGVRMTDLRNWNSISFDNDALLNGQELIVTPSNESKLDVIVKTNNLIHVASGKNGRHRVKKGQTLQDVAQMYEIKVEDLAKANGLSPKVRIGQGLVLLLPSKASINRKLHTSYNNAKVKKVYAVKKGDSFAKIASKLGISEKDLKKWNPGIRSNALVKGKRLTMYTKAAKITVSKKSKNSKGVSTSKSSHTIRKGESLSKIADKYGISVQQLTKINKKIKPKDLKAGQTIKLK